MALNYVDSPSSYKVAMPLASQCSQFQADVVNAIWSFLSSVLLSLLVNGVVLDAHSKVTEAYS